MTSHIFNAPDMNQLHDDMCLTLAYAPSAELDTQSLIDVSMHNVIATADSMKWDFNLKNLWLGKARWSTMVRQYLDPQAVSEWLQMCAKVGHKGRGTATLRTRTVQSQGGLANGMTNRERRRWGSCMLSMSYKALPTPTITLHSRTSYMGYLSVLDLSVAQTLGRYVGKILGIPIESFHFVWMIESIQYHSFKSLAYLLCNADEDIRRTGRRVLLKPLDQLTVEERLLITAPAVKASRVWLNKVRREDAAGVTLGDMNYNTYRRIRRRWHTELFGVEYGRKFEGWSYYKEGHPKEGQEREFFKAYRPLPHVMVSGLDLSAIKMPFRALDTTLFANIEPEEVDDNICLECGSDD